MLEWILRDELSRLLTLHGVAVDERAVADVAREIARGIHDAIDPRAAEDE